eukprot:jgi/Astpho2/858/gw1.00016.307.1_t
MQSQSCTVCASRVSQLSTPCCAATAVLTGITLDASGLHPAQARAASGILALSAPPSK